MLLTTVFLALVAVHGVRCSWRDGDNGVDRSGGDLPNMPIIRSVGSPGDCADACDKNSNCAAWAFGTSGCGGLNTTACWLKNTVMPQSLDSCRVSGVKNASLLAPKFNPLPVGSIKPAGWLKRQVEIQAAGLSGHLDLFWADVENSSWFGGNADVGLHERAPYWLNGIVPLAYQLQNQSLMEKVKKYVAYIMAHQASNGWLGNDDINDGNCYWSKYFIMFTLRQYYEATGDDSVFPVMFKFLHAAHKRMFTTPLGTTWSAARWQDLVLSVHWLLDFHPQEEEQFLWDLAELLHQQGFDWKNWYGSSDFPTDAVNTATLFTHGVNNGQAIKSEGVWYRQSHNKSDWNSSYVRMLKLDKYHGQASGIFACDEHLAGRMPSRGTELCTVVESMYSWEILFAIQGDPIFAERAEQLAYNALPATFTSDMWAHQYLQQDNEMNAVVSPDHVWQFDGPDSTTYGLAPNYGCCTANFNQGWPKFLQHMVMISPDGGTVVVATYGPLSASVMGVHLTMETDYPFGDTVQVNATCNNSKTLLFRIPSWTTGGTVQTNGGSPSPASNGTLKAVQCQGSVSVTLTFPMSIRVQRRYNNAASVYRGPLLYGLEIKEVFKVLRSYAFESKDYEVTPGSTWNYAILLKDDDHPEQDLHFQNLGVQPNVPPFSILGAPSKITATGRVLDSWGVSHNAASAPPTSPVETSNPDQQVTLLPFGATELRIAEIPTFATE